MKFIDESHVLSYRLSDLCSEYLYEEGNMCAAKGLGSPGYWQTQASTEERWVRAERTVH